MLKLDRSLTEVDDIRAYVEDRNIVLDDPERFGVAAILTFLHESDFTVDEVFAKQRKLDMSLSKKEIERILGHLVRKGYASKTNGSGYGPTRKLVAALERDGVSEALLLKLADVLIR